MEYKPHVAQPRLRRFDGLAGMFFFWRVCVQCFESWNLLFCGRVLKGHQQQNRFFFFFLFFGPGGLSFSEVAVFVGGFSREAKNKNIPLEKGTPILVGGFTCGSGWLQAAGLAEPRNGFVFLLGFPYQAKGVSHNTPWHFNWCPEMVDIKLRWDLRPMVRSNRTTSGFLVFSLVNSKGMRTSFCGIEQLLFLWAA